MRERKGKDEKPEEVTWAIRAMETKKQSNGNAEEEEEYFGGT